MSCLALSYLILSYLILSYLILSYLILSYLILLAFISFLQSHVLNHQAGLANAGLQEISRDPFIVCDSDLILSVMAQSTPEHAPGAQTNYHYLTFGWLVEGLVKSITGGTLKDFVNTNIAIQQNIQSEFMIGIASSHTEQQSQEQEQEQADRLQLLYRKSVKYQTEWPTLFLAGL